jgi:Holliday junction resolvasome RuvABC DNA-binding subunit
MRQSDYQAMVRIGGYGDRDANKSAIALKEEIEKDNAEMLREYQNVKDTARQAVEILEKIQANE